MESTNGVLTIVDFRECALVIGDTDLPDHVLSFGALSAPDCPEAVAQARLAADVIEKLGPPRVVAERWTIGR